jgi:hypothetical protein
VYFRVFDKETDKTIKVFRTTVKITKYTQKFGNLLIESPYSQEVSVPGFKLYYNKLLLASYDSDFSYTLSKDYLLIGTENESRTQFQYSVYRLKDGKMVGKMTKTYKETQYFSVEALEKFNTFLIDSKLYDANLRPISRTIAETTARTFANEEVYALTHPSTDTTDTYLMNSKTGKPIVLFSSQTFFDIVGQYALAFETKDDATTFKLLHFNSTFSKNTEVSSYNLLESYLSGYGYSHNNDTRYFFLTYDNSDRVSITKAVIWTGEKLYEISEDRIIPPFDFAGKNGMVYLTIDPETNLMGAKMIIGILP